jgi:geranylgeranyl diphosphate synthase type II
MLDKLLTHEVGGMIFDDYLSKKKTLIDNAIESMFKKHDPLISRLTEAMRYSLMAGGKRLRPVLCVAGAEAVGGNQMDVLPVACALELIHTYSLIHDDLPVMDDDDLRRGKPSNHKVFGDAVALLAGDALLTEAFHLMTSRKARQGASDTSLLKVINLIAGASGYMGMAGGQVVDIQSEGKHVDPLVVEFIHTRKTGALITASVTSGAILGRGKESQIQAIYRYGQKIGLAFQITDDILNVEGDRKTIGKDVGSDKKRGKVTYPDTAGITKSRETQSNLIGEAMAAIEDFNDAAEPLRLIAKYIIERKK